MPILSLLYLALGIQTVIMVIDEFYHHRRRGLPQWEKWGHPLDTLSVLSVFISFILAKPPLPGENTPNWLVGLMIFSCLFITKDEWVHHRHSTAAEQWLHSILFMIHPLVFICAWWVWKEEGAQWIHRAQAVALGGFAFYQLVYWNFFRREETFENRPVNNALYETLGDRWYDAKDDPVALLRAESKVKNPWVRKKILENVSHFNASDLKVLDIGCGAGFLSNDLALHSLQVTGLDFSASSLAVAKAHDVTQTVQYIEGDAYALPFDDESFEAITCMDFLEHVENPARVIQEASRVLKPNGVFKI